MYVSGAEPFHFDIHDYSIAACDAAAYADEIVKDDKVYLNVDYKHAVWAEIMAGQKISILNIASVKDFIIINL